jgi:hypothetical protein
VYAPRIVSKLLPDVLIVTLPLDGAVHDHHTDLPPELPAWFGSPDSLVAQLLAPLTVDDEPLIDTLLAKLSFAGGCGIVTVTLDAYCG